MTSPLEAARVTHTILRDKLLEQMPELSDDRECLLDTLEGLTDFQDQLAALARSAASDEAMLEGLTQYQVKLADRRSAIAARMATKRRIVLHYMEDAGIKKITKPDITISRRAIAPSVIITDESKIPSEYLRTKFEPDKTKIKEALKDGEPVPGAILSNGSETLALKI